MGGSTEITAIMSIMPYIFSICVHQLDNINLSTPHSALQTGGDKIVKFFSVAAPLAAVIHYGS
ncbi:MAG: hypothetical protein C4523_18695 [Myxococcales bacterium]|nr:MAG: hypothetical protein C4523_18695 [Myxococcales bacterium]